MNAINNFADTLAATINNGRDVVGFAHLSDVGVDPAHYARIVNGDLAGNPVLYTKIQVVGNTAVAGLVTPDNLAYARLIGQAALANAGIARASVPLVGGIPNPFLTERLLGLMLMGRAWLCVHGLFDRVGNNWAECVQALATDTDDAAFALHNALITATLHYSISQGALVAICAAINHWSSNHNTTGKILPIGMIKAFCSIANCAAPVMSTPEGKLNAEHLTNVFYTMVHPGSKRKLAALFYPEGGPVTTGITPDITVIAGSVRVFTTELDAWSKIRWASEPSGTHALTICKAGLTIMARDGILVFHPANASITLLSAALGRIHANAARYHIGATYYTGLAPLHDADDMVALCKEYLPDIACYLTSAGKGATILASARMVAATLEGSTTAWIGICTAFNKARGSVADATQINAVVTAMGGATAAIDPTLNGGADLRAAMDAVIDALHGV